MNPNPRWRAWALALVSVLVLGPCALCSGSLLWLTRPQPLQVAQAPTLAPPAWQGEPTAAAVQAWLSATWLYQDPQARVLEGWLGAWPPDWGLTPPDDGRALGALRVTYAEGVITQAWLDLPATDDALARWQAHLTRAGWHEPRWARLLTRLEAALEQPDAPPGGFQPAPGEPWEPPPTRLWCTPDGALAEMSWWQTDARLVVHLRLDGRTWSDTLPPPCTWRAWGQWLRQAARALADGPGGLGVVRAPTLTPPPQVTVHTTGLLTYDQRRSWGYAVLQGADETLRPDALWAHYAAQLEAQGWRLAAHAQTPQVARGRWTHPRVLGAAWTLEVILVHDAPGQASAWLFLYRADEGPAPASRALAPAGPPRVTWHADDPTRAADLLRAWQTTPGWWIPRGERLAFPPELPAAPLAWPAAIEPVGVVQGAWGRGAAVSIWLLHGSAPAADLQAPLEAALTDAGWQPYAPGPPRPLPGLLAPNTTPLEGNARPRQYCHPTTGQLLSWHSLPTANQGTWLWLNLEPDVPCEAATLPPPPASGRLDPSLTLPPDLPRRPLGALGTPRLQVEGLWVRTDDLAALRAALDAQMHAQGWTPVAQGRGPDVAWSVWRAGDGRQARVYLGRMEATWTWVALVVSEPAAP